MSLLELQDLFWRAARGQVAPEVLDAHFVARGPRTGAGRMRIYNGAYFARLEEALADTFPSTKILLGQERFQGLARRYIIERPSESPALERIGTHFAELLRAKLPIEEHLIADVAELERARVSSLLAPEDAAVTGPLNLTGVNLSTVRFGFVRSLVVCVVPAQAFHAWQQPTSWVAAARDTNKRVGVAFWRRGFSVHHRSLELGEASALSGSEHSVSLLGLCEQLAEYDDAVTRAFAMIENWRSSGLIARVEREPSEEAGATDANT